MTDPAEGKLGLNGVVYLVSNEKKVKLDDPFVCIHVKGYSLARVTHLDIEHDILDNIIPPKRGRLHDIKGIKEGIEVRLEGNKEIEYQGSKLRPQSILVRCSILNKILTQGQSTRTWSEASSEESISGSGSSRSKRWRRLRRRCWGVFQNNMVG